MGFFNKKKKKDKEGFVDLTNKPGHSGSSNYQVKQREQAQKRIRQSTGYSQGNTEGYKDFTKNPVREYTGYKEPSSPNTYPQQPSTQSSQTSEASTSETSQEGGGIGGFFGGFFGGGREETENSNTTQQTQNPDSIYGNTINPEEKRRRLSKRLKDMTERMENLSDELYHLQQRLELIERKLDIR